MDAAEYKHVVLGLIFLKYISDAFEEQHAKLVAEQADERARRTSCQLVLPFPPLHPPNPAERPSR